MRKQPSLWTRFCGLPWIIQYGICLGIALLAVPALAGDLTVHKPGLDLRLQAKPCADAKVLAIVPPHLHGHLLHGAVVLEGKPMGVCWMDRGAHLLLIFDDGSGGPFERGVFREEVGV